MGINSTLKPSDSLVTRLWSLKLDGLHHRREREREKRNSSGVKERGTQTEEQNYSRKIVKEASLETE